MDGPINLELFFFFLTKDMSISFIKDQEYKALSIKIYKIIAICYKVTQSYI
jgi:hypothetical protein